MKQSTKLLSLILALVLAFSCFSVIGNAALVKTEITYDNIDDADLSPEQVADIALDLVDNDLLADMEDIDLSIVGTLKLNSIDNALSSIEDLLGGFVWAIGKGLLGDVGDFNFNAIDGVRRGGGDLNVIYALLQFIADNAGRVSKIAYGIGTSNGIDLGLIESFLDLGETGDLLADLPGFLVTMVYDMLIYGSYGYDYDAEELGGKKSNLPANVQSLDGIVRQALLGLLTSPQDYEWVGEGKDAVKEWDMSSVILDSSYNNDNFWNTINPFTKSLFQILDAVAPIAIEKFGIPALNNNLKKGLMEACEVEFNEIDIEDIKDANVLEKFADEASYVNYIAYDCIAKAANGTWYYTTLKTKPVDLDGDGITDVDEEGNGLYKRTRVYYKANFGAANEFAGLINWDWNFVGEAGGKGTQLLYSDLTSDGTIAGGINWLLGMVWDTALTQETRDDFFKVTGETFYYGDNTNLNQNIPLITKYVLATFGEKIWGKGSPYATLTWDDVKDYDLIQLVAMIGPSFFEDAMPQIILPKNEDGSYAFSDDSTIILWQFAAIVLRELITGIAPNVNYDEYIFLNGDVTSADDRLFANNDAETWFNIILNMALDLGYTYLNNITNFNTAIPAKDITEQRWMDMLDPAINWAVDYVGEGGYGILNGINPDTIEAMNGDPIGKLNYILNTILPLGFIGEAYAPDENGLDLNLLIAGLKNLISTFDLTVLTTLFGRNTNAGLNIFGSTSLVSCVLQLVNRILNLVFGTNILQAVVTSGTQSLDTVVSQANLKITVNTLLTALNNRKQHILISALPVVGKLIKGWGTEQAFEVPEIDLPKTITSASGSQATAQTVEVKNASNGVWKHYTLADGSVHQSAQYIIVPVSVNAYNYDGTKSSYMTVNLTDTAEIGYGQKGSFTYTLAGIPQTGAAVRVVYEYKVKGEDGQLIANGQSFKAETYAWLNWTGTDEGTWHQAASMRDMWFLGTHVEYVDMSNPQGSLEGAQLIAVERKNRALSDKGDIPDSSIISGEGEGLTSFAIKDVDKTSKFAPGNGDRVWERITPYTNYQHVPGGDKGEDDVKNNSTENYMTIVSTYDQNSWDALNRRSGDKANFGVKIYLYASFWGSEEGWKNVQNDFYYYDGAGRNRLISLVEDEIEAMRKKTDYLQSGYSLANTVLEAEDVGTDVYADTFQLRETNYTETATNAKGETVTQIDNAAAWTRYYNALQAALKGAYCVFYTYGTNDPNGGAVNTNVTAWNYKELYNELRVAINDLQYCEDINAAKEYDVAGTIDSLKTATENLQASSTDLYDFTDYKMYRLNRFNDTRDDAWYYINLKNDQSNATVAEIDEVFPYIGIEEDDLRNLVEGDPNEELILATLDIMDEDERNAKANWLDNKKKEYAGLDYIDVVMTYIDINNNYTRLLKRDGAGEYTQHLEDEIASAEAMITDSSLYTAGSWANYQDALNNAKAALNSGSQKLMFDAKYNLLVERKELVEVGKEADYNELNTLIAQAKQALANQNLYDNTARDFGRVLAELGYDEIDGTQLFPGSALLTVAEAYGEDDQDKVDRASKALKEVLAKLKFRAVNVSGATLENATIVEADEENGVEAVVYEAARIDAEMLPAAVKALFKVEADGAVIGTNDITVSSDNDYAVVKEISETSFAGTNATVTFYKQSGDVKIPVLTIKLIVDGDINGDGAVDVLDATYGALVSQNKTDLSGCYLLAGDLVGNDKEVTADDYSQIVNKAVA